MTESRHRQEIDRFRAVSDSGEEFVVLEFRTITEQRKLDGTTRRHEGRVKIYTLEDGSTVTKIDDETFSILQSGETIRKL